MFRFMIKKKGTNEVVQMFAKNTLEAKLKAERLFESRKMLQVNDPMLRPGSLNNTRRIFKGRK